MPSLSQIRTSMRKAHHQTDADALKALLDTVQMSKPLEEAIQSRAISLVKSIRKDSQPGLMESFLAEYGLSTSEGVALMCLAEALLRVPDADTIDALIEDKIAPSAWGEHLGQSSSTLVNASSWALFMTGKVLKEDDQGGIIATLHSAIKRLGEPVIRTAVGRAMKEMGRQFVLGQTIEDAVNHAKKRESEGYTYSYDMLGEAARTEGDARRYHLSYSDAITALAKACTHEDIRDNPGVSVKLSALHARYEPTQYQRVMEELVPRARSLALLAKSAGMGFNIDAEEANRLDLSLDVIEAVLSDPSLKNWDGFGVVVQAYGKRASYVLDWLYALAEKLDRKIMVRLVKGAYWDTEIKLAQVEGHDGFPVFSRKQSTDVSYLTCAQKLLGMTDRVYPQFATHNAHSVAAILEMATDKRTFEFQRLHGMGEALHDTVLNRHDTRCRIYAPVGKHKDLLAYLVRRLLENGANSSFVNQIVDETVPPEEVVADPFAAVRSYLPEAHNPHIALPQNIFAPRKNAKGWDLSDPITLKKLLKERNAYATKTWGQGNTKITNPTDGSNVGAANFLTKEQTATKLATLTPWQSPAHDRTKALRKAADLYEANAPEIFAILACEAGKTIFDCIGELREAVDFLRYYADQAELKPDAKPLGIVTCISPWNFPLAIFTGQIAAALAAGNAVAAKPAETTPLISELAVKFMHDAGIPHTALQLFPGEGAVVGTSLTSTSKVNGVTFTGSTATAQRINRTMAKNLDPFAPLIAETGGLNAMIVDSTALPEQAVRDILASSFQSAGQRCSALRCLYVQEDIADDLLKMLFGAMDAQTVGNPWDISTDIGPVIDKAAKDKIDAHIEKAKTEGRVIKTILAPQTGTFVAPTVIRVGGILEMTEEIFGPVLHVATFKSSKLDQVINDINATGYGLTFGLHTRIDDRVQYVVERIRAGNVYVNRNQIGAIVGSQPFGGEGLSGTGPKAGGPDYLPRFHKPEQFDANKQALIPDPLVLPGPTGESNRMSYASKHTVLCVGPDAKVLAKQAEALGCQPVIETSISPDALAKLTPLDAVLYSGTLEDAKPLRAALAQRDGMIVPLISEANLASRLLHERHVCVDTTAAGGNATLLAIED